MSTPGAVSTDALVVEILLSTWNGEEYLPALLASLQAQTVAGCLRLLVRDDGSTDGTIRLLRSYALEHPEVRLIEGDNVGVMESFHQLMTQASPEADLFMLCDQDDVWLPDKVAAALAEMAREVDVPEPAMYCSRSMVTDSLLHPLGPTADHRRTDFRHALIQNIAPGHTMMVNRALVELAARDFPTSEMLMHDHWLYLIAAGLGRVHFDHRWHTLYRSHGENVIGYEVGFPRRAANAFGVLARQDLRPYTRQARAFADCFEHKLSKRDRTALNGFLRQDTVNVRAAYVVRFPLIHENWGKSALADLLFLAGRYKLP